MKLGIQLHLVGLSLSDTVSVLASLGVDQCRPPFTTGFRRPTYSRQRAVTRNVAVDETVIRVNDQRYWLFAAVDPDTDRLLHVRLFSTRTSALTEMFLAELREKHLVSDAIFLLDGAPWLQAACHHHSLRFQHVTHENRNAVERVFKKLKRRTEAFANHFRHTDPNTAETWLQAYAVCFNQ